MDRGIAAAGNLIVDYIKIIDRYPKQGMLSSISKISKCIGGCAANTLISLAAMDSGLPLKCLGMAGEDDNGRYIISVLKKYGIDTSGILTSRDAPTSFTDVMTVSGSGERTFFHARGANAEYSFEHMDFDAVNADIFHIGYALLMDSLDREDPGYGTVMARALSTARDCGMKTSMDVVSENSDRFSKVVTPSLKFCDYLIVNEVEASMICGIPARDESGKIVSGNIRKLCEALLDKGVREIAVIHAPEAGWYMDRTGEYVVVPSLKLPPGYIKGSVGAGDAFCAGMLYSIYSGYEPERSLKLASAAAAACLSEENSIDGMRPIPELLELERRYGRNLPL